VTSPRGYLGPPRALFGAAAVSALLALVPLLYLVVRVVDAGLESVLEGLARPRTWETVATSLALTGVVVVACLAVGLPIAWLLARTSVAMRRMWLVLVALPLRWTGTPAAQHRQASPAVAAVSRWQGGPKPPMGGISSPRVGDPTRSRDPFSDQKEHLPSVAIPSLLVILSLRSVD
jgi:hypothetical protein